MTNDNNDHLIERKEYILEFLRTEGYRPTLNVDDGDIEFKKEGSWFYISLFEDKLFYRILMPSIKALENKQELERGHKAAVLITKNIKVAKVLVVNDGEQVVVTAETFCWSAEAFTSMFQRFMDVMKSARQDFLAKMAMLEKENSI